jgi:hypothetical protein
MGAVSSARDDAWAAVLGPLYEAVKAAHPGSLEEQVAERALDYAITALASDPSRCMTISETPGTTRCALSGGKLSGCRD